MESSTGKLLYGLHSGLEYWSTLGYLTQSGCFLRLLATGEGMEIKCRVGFWVVFI